MRNMANDTAITVWKQMVTRLIVEIISQCANVRLSWSITETNTRLIVEIIS